MMLSGKIAVVTGGAGAMGLAVCRFLLEDGAAVALIDVDEARLQAVSTALEGNVLPVACDISNSSSVHSAYEQVLANLGPVDILVNNAGILSGNKAEQTTDEEWHRVLSVNLDGAFYWARAVLGEMKKRRWGRIVNVCSLAAKTGGLTAGTAYATSKGALASLTFSLARESAPFGVTVNGIAPSYVNTPMITGGLTEEQLQRLPSQIPVGRLCRPEEFAHTVRFLVSPLAGFITGEIVDVNGGLHMD